MQIDNYGRQILTEDDLCDAYLKNPDIIINNAIVDKLIKFNSQLELEKVPKLSEFTDLNISVKEFDKISQDNWYIPDEYKNMDIAQWVLDQCIEDHELQRVGEELIRYQELEMFPVLRYCKYLVDTMRKHNIVWGVGRGSSVSSYVLFLIGIHRINSLHYDLSIDEFLK